MNICIQAFKRSEFTKIVGQCPLEKKLTCSYGVFFVPDILVDKNTTCHKYLQGKLYITRTTRT